MNPMDVLSAYLDTRPEGGQAAGDAQRRKAQALERARNQYDALVAAGDNEEKALARVIVDLGARAEVSKDPPPKNTGLKALAAVFLPFWIAGAAFGLYCAKNAQVWKAYYRLMPLIVFSYFVRPALFFCGAYLALFLAGKLFPDFGRLAVRSGRVRTALLAVSLLGVCLYYLVTANYFLGFMRIGVFSRSVFSLQAAMGYIFLLLGGLFYCGVKK